MPLLESTPLSARIGARVYRKLESVQPIGSFKIRGLGREQVGLPWRTGGSPSRSTALEADGLSDKIPGDQTEFQVTGRIPG